MLYIHHNHVTSLQDMYVSVHVCLSTCMSQYGNFVDLSIFSSTGYPVINVYIVDVITGHMIFHGNHRKAQGPVHVVHSENWVVVSYSRKTL